MAETLGATIITNIHFPSINIFMNILESVVKMKIIFSNKNQNSKPNCWKKNWCLEKVDEANPELQHMKNILVNMIDSCKVEKI